MNRFRRPHPVDGPPRVLVAGGGVAALEACLALRALVGERLRITLLAPGPAFVHRPAATPDPLAEASLRRLPLSRIAASTGAELHVGRLVAVEPQAACAFTEAGDELPYDALVVAVGALPTVWLDRAVPVGDRSREPELRMLLHDLERGAATAAAFVAPPGPWWRLELYELALEAAVLVRRSRRAAELTLVTPEEAPLAILGPRVAAGVRHTLASHGVRVIPAAYARSFAGGRLRLSPGDRHIAVDRVAAATRLRGPGLAGVPCDADGFLPADRLGRVRGADGVYAAGDCASFPVKHASLAAQQADAAASAIAARLGVRATRTPFKPVLCCMLPARLRWYVEAPISGGQGDAAALSPHPLWSPATRFGSRFLSPYLAKHEPRSDASGHPRTSLEQVRRAFRRLEDARS